MNRQAIESRIREAFGVAAEWHEAPSLEDLPAIALPGINRLLEVDATGWNDLDLATGRLRLLTYPDDAGFMGDVDLLEELIDQHPLLPALLAEPDRPPVTWTDVAPRRRLERTDLYQEFMRPNGIANQMTFVVETTPWIALTVNRGGGEFSGAQRELATLLRPHLRAAFRTIKEREDGRRRLQALDRGLREVAGAVVVLGPGGVADYVSPAAAQILARWFAEDGADVLPESLRDLRSARRFHDSGAELRVRRLATDPPLLLLTEHRLAPDPGRVAALGLTAREAQILACVARGLADAEIAQELYLSPRTVAKHLQNAYDKLGVRERGAAAALVLGQAPASVDTGPGRG